MWGIKLKYKTAHKYTHNNRNTHRNTTTRTHPQLRSHLLHSTEPDIEASVCVNDKRAGTVGYRNDTSALPASGKCSLYVSSAWAGRRNRVPRMFLTSPDIVFLGITSILKLLISDYWWQPYFNMKKIMKVSRKTTTIISS